MPDDITPELPLEPIQPVQLQDEMETSFLDYAMSVIMARALPDVRDGLKPVHRRIIWDMDQQGFRPDRPTLKCARVTGEVMGKYHPHGDGAIYDALVRMAQPFSLRHPLIDFHGNYGSPDFGPAAERYTECRLTPLAMQLGCARAERRHRFTSYQAEIERGRALLMSLAVTPNEARRAGLNINLDGQRRTAYDLLSYPNYDFAELQRVWPESLGAIAPKVAEALEIEAGYSVYLDRQATAIADQQRDEQRQIPYDFNYATLSGLSNELKAKLGAARPVNIAQAAVVEGMTPAAVALLLVHLRRLNSSDRHSA